MAYSFYFRRAGRGVPDVESADCEDDREALSTGERLLAAHGDADEVEVMRGEEVVGVVKRPWLARVLGGGEGRPFIFPG